MADVQQTPEKKNVVVGGRSLKDRSGKIVLNVFVALILQALCIFVFSFFFESTLLKWVFQFLQLFIYCAFMYTTVVKYGDQDRTYVDRGHISFDFWYGFKLGLLPNLFAVATLVILLLAKLEITPDIFFLYEILNPHWFPLLNILVPTSSIYDVTWWHAIIFIAMSCLTLPVVCGISYLLGYKRFFIEQKIIYKKDSK